MSDVVRMRWMTVGIGLLWAGLLLVSSMDQWIGHYRDEVRDRLPVSFWFRAGQTNVGDAAPGTCPPMTFDREIVGPFSAEWTVTILRDRGDGTLETHRTFRGRNDYRPENVLPPAIDLCWWAGVSDPAALGLEEGETYRVNTLWKVEAGGGPPRIIRRSSLPFAIVDDRES